MMNGVLVVNKPMGISSSDACLKVKRILGFRKVGHLGTLDPLATGVLPLCINEGTKLVQFLLKSEKEYVAAMHLGMETDTQDSQGKVIRESGRALPADDVIRSAFREFQGELFQMPPMYSALKHKGVPLYKIARKGGSVPREKRRVLIRELEVLDIEKPRVLFRVVCSHGTYVRTLCHDVGRRLACGAHMTSLERVRNGMFHIRQSLGMDDFDAVGRTGIIQRYLIPPKEALNGMPEVVVDSGLEKRIRNGVQILNDDIAGLDMPNVLKGQPIKVLSSRGELIGVVQALAEGESESSGPAGATAWKTLRIFLN